MNIDYSQWPVWLVAVLLFVNLFREPLAALIAQAIPDHFRHYAGRRADREEHDQELEEVQLNARLQTAAAEQLRKSWREENLMSIVQEKDAFERGLFDKLSTSLDRLSDRMEQFHRQQIRTNDLLTTLNITMSRFVNGRGGDGKEG